MRRETDSRNAAELRLRCGLALVALMVLAEVASGTTLLHRNLGELVELADDIVLGEVVEIREGVIVGLPFTEVSIAVGETIRGQRREILRFRQFGRQAPRRLPDGRLLEITTPVGWPRFVLREKVLLFLAPAAARTGLRTTVGLGQGTFRIYGGRARNDFGNVGLFSRLRLPRSAGEQPLMQAGQQPLPVTELLLFLRRAVAEGWFDGGTP